MPDEHVLDRIARSRSPMNTRPIAIHRRRRPDARSISTRYASARSLGMRNPSARSIATRNHRPIIMCVVASAEESPA